MTMPLLVNRVETVAQVHCPATRPATDFAPVGGRVGQLHLSAGSLHGPPLYGTVDDVAAQRVRELDHQRRLSQRRQPDITTAHDVRRDPGDDIVQGADDDQRVRASFIGNREVLAPPPPKD